MRKTLLAVISLILLFTFLFGVSTENVFAEDINYEENGVFKVEIPRKGNVESRSISEVHEHGKTTSVIVNDPSIAKASFKNFKTAEGYSTEITITFKKAGKVYLTHNQVENGSGQPFVTYGAYEAKMINYSSPVKTLKIGKTDLTKKAKNSRVFTGKAFKGKVSFKLKKGWKLSKMEKHTIDRTTGRVTENTKLKKNKTFKLKKGEELYMLFKKGKKISYIKYIAK